MQLFFNKLYFITFFKIVAVDDRGPICHGYFTIVNELSLNNYFVMVYTTITNM